MTQPNNRFQWQQWWPILVVALAFILVYPSIFDEKLDMGGDNAGYFILGKSLAEGQGYSDIHYFPSQPANHFPPGYPFLLALLMKLGLGLLGMKMVNGLLLLASGILLLNFFKTTTPRTPLAVVAVLLMILNTHLLRYSTILMSEIPFLFCSAGVLIAFGKFIASEKPFWKNPWFWATLVGAVLAYHIRTAGLALVGGVLLALLIYRKWTAFGLWLSGFILLALPWFLRGQKLGGSSYLSQLFAKNPYRPELGQMAFSDWITRFGDNLSRYVSKEIPNGLFPNLSIANYQEGSSATLWLVGLAILGLSAFGWHRLQSAKPLVAGYILGSFGILLLWPEVWFGVRFFLPLIPLFLFLTVVGVDGLLAWAFGKVKLKAPSGWLTLVLVLPLMGTVKQLRDKTKEPYEVKYRNFFELGQFANQNLPTNAIIANRKPGLFYLYANRYVAGIPNEVNYGKVIELFKKQGVTHVVIDQLGYASTSRYLVPVVQAEPEKFNVIKVTAAPETYLLEFKPDLGYQGQYTDADPEQNIPGRRTGTGQFVYADGRIFEGTWANGLRNGPGKLKLLDGRSLNGTWRNDSLQQPAQILDATGRVEFEGVISESGSRP
jgi:hypothetical protein